jgi:23S rRNA (guanosine2251-2'-O)-methyltransferase
MTTRKLSMEELGRLSVREFKESKKLPVVVVLDNVRSLHNVGSAFRTCDAFSISTLYLTGITGTPPHREIQKAALGATESVPWHYAEHTPALLQKLKDEGYTLVAVEQTTNSQLLHNFMPVNDSRHCLVFGNEVEGVSDEALALCDFSVEVPQSGTKHSLNISVCMGIVLWHMYRELAL